MTHIIVVEDDADIREHLTKILTDEDYEVDSFETGSTALAYLQHSHPDLILLDLELPDLGGDEICKLIKQNTPDIPVIILTSKDSHSEIVDGIHLGADEYVTKPFESTELLARIEGRLPVGPVAAVM